MSRERYFYPSVGQDRVLLDGGLNNKFDPNLIEDSESPDCKNVVFGEGSVGTRQGYVKLNSNVIGGTGNSFVGDGLYTRRSRTGVETMVAFAGGSAWTWDTNTFATIPSAQSVFTAGVRVATAQYENHMFVGNGGVIPYKYNGTDWTRHGVYPPNASHISSPTFSAASQAAGSNFASGSSYTYKVVFVNSQSVAGNPGTAVTFVAAANSQVGTIRLTSIPVGPQSFGVAARRIYRTENGGSTYKLVTTIEDNTTTTYDDTTQDAGLGATAPSDNGVPPMYSTIAYHKDRLFCNDPENPNLVKYSGVGEPYTFGALAFESFADDAGDTVKAIDVHNDGIVVRCEKSVWLWYMPTTTTTDWRKVRLNAPYGSKSPFGGILFNDKFMFPAMQTDKFVGFAAISGGSIAPSSSLLTLTAVGSELQSNPIEPDMFDVQAAFVGNISGIVYQNKAWIAVTYGSGNTTNNRVYYADFSATNLKRSGKIAWVPFTGINAAQFTIYDGKLYFIDSRAVGRVYQLESGSYNDDGSAIDSYYWTKEFSGLAAHSSLHKDFRWLAILVDKAGNYYMEVRKKVDSDTGSGEAQQVDLDPGGSQWGVMVWGTDSWGGGTERAEIKVGLGTAAGQRIQFKFSNQNTVNQRFKVHWVRFIYNKKGYR
jgi:hypothetical protein